MKESIFAIAMLVASGGQITPTEQARCENLADYAQGVAILRDQGVRLKDVNEVTAERASGTMLRAYNRVAKVVYNNGDVTPEQSYEIVLDGCVTGIIDSKKNER